jgi:flagellar biosynthesis/type III secretory pathway protein FliH
VTARLHPRDVRLLAGEDDALKLPAGTHLTLIGDETVMLGGCVVETDAGLFEGSLDTQLRKLHAVLNRSTLIDGQV